MTDGTLISKFPLTTKSIGIAYRRSDDRIFVQSLDGSLFEVRLKTRQASDDLEKFNYSMLAEQRTVFFTEDMKKGVAIAV